MLLCITGFNFHQASVISTSVQFYQGVDRLTKMCIMNSMWVALMESNYMTIMHTIRSKGELLKDGHHICFLIWTVMLGI